MEKSEKTRAKLIPGEVAKRLRVSPSKVVSWIRSGELRAIDVSSPGSTRPRFLIDPQDLEDFEESRVVTPAVKIPRRFNRMQKEGLVRHFR